jgi:acyl-CoA dehydrogenase
LKKVVAAEAAEKKLERAIREGTLRRFHDNDWIAEAATKNIVTEEEAKQLAEIRDLVEKVIAVDAFDADELTGRRQRPHSASAPPDSIAAE